MWLQHTKNLRDGSAIIRDMLQNVAANDHIQAVVGIWNGCDVDLSVYVGVHQIGGGVIQIRDLTQPPFDRRFRCEMKDALGGSVG